MARTGLLFSLLSALLVLAPAVPAEMGQPDALALVEGYNARNLGSPGCRRVSLELRDGARTTRRFVVTNLWLRDQEEVKTLFVLEQPANLLGTNYLLHESRELPAGMSVYLHLPAGKRQVLSVAPSHFDVGLLGSEFGYRDVRMLIPTAGYDFRIVGRKTLLGYDTWVVEAEATTAQTQASSWARSHFYLAADPPLLLAADHYARAEEAARGSSAARKRMRVHGLEEHDGTWTETRIVISAGESRSSVLTLEDYATSLAGVDPEIFTTEALPRLVAGQLTARSQATRTPNLEASR